MADPDEALIEAIAREEAVKFWGECAEESGRLGWCDNHQSSFRGQALCTLVFDGIELAENTARAMVAHLGLVERSMTIYEVGYFTTDGFAVLQYAGTLGQCEDMLRTHPEWFNPPESRVLSKTSRWLESAPRGEWTEVDHGSE